MGDAAKPIKAAHGRPLSGHEYSRLEIGPITQLGGEIVEHQNPVRALPLPPGPRQIGRAAPSYIYTAESVAPLSVIVGLRGLRYWGHGFYWNWSP